jgi:hypothetical protein
MSETRQPGYYRALYQGAWMIVHLNKHGSIELLGTDLTANDWDGFEEFIPISPKPQQVTDEEIWECISKHSGIEVDYLKSRREVLSISVKGIVEIMRELTKTK